MFKKKKEKIKDSKTITELIKENYAWIIAVLGVFGVIILNIFRFVEYITGSAYFSYYGLDINLYKYYDQKFLYELCIYIIFMCAVGSLMYCYKQISYNFKNKIVFSRENFYNFIIIIFSNLYLIFMLKIEFNMMTIIICLLSLIIIESIISYFAFRDKKKESTETITLKQEFINYIKFLPFAIIILMMCQIIRIYSSLSIKSEYRIIEDNKVIVYSNNDYFLTLDCEKDGDNLVIYKGTQTKIDNTSVYSKLEKFKDVKIK